MHGYRRILYISQLRKLNIAKEDEIDPAAEGIRSWIRAQFLSWYESSCLNASKPGSQQPAESSFPIAQGLSIGSSTSLAHISRLPVDMVNTPASELQEIGGYGTASSATKAQEEALLGTGTGSANKERGLGTMYSSVPSNDYNSSSAPEQYADMDCFSTPVAEHVNANTGLEITDPASWFLPLGISMGTLDIP